MSQEEIGLQNGQGAPVQNMSGQGAGEPNISVAPGIDEELDNSLEKFFNSNSVVETPVKEEKPKEVVKNEPKEIKKEESKVNQPNPKETKASEPEIEEATESAPKDQSAWTALKNKAKNAHKSILDRDEEIARLKKTLAERGNTTTKETEAIKAEMEELKKFRAMVDIQADPEFVSKYDAPIDSAISSIKSMLKEIDPTVTDQSLALINFSDSAYMDQILKFIDGKADRFKTRKIESKIQEILALNDKRDETLNEHKGKYKEYLENKKKETFTKQSEEEGRILTHIENTSNAKDANNNPLYPFLAQIEVTDTTDEATRNKINLHNGMVDQMRKKLDTLLAVKTPEERAEVAIAAVGAHYLSAQLRAALKKLAGVEAQLKKVSVVTTENEDPKPRRVAAASNGGQVSTDDALRDFMQSR